MTSQIHLKMDKLIHNEHIYIYFFFFLQKFFCMRYYETCMNENFNKLRYVEAINVCFSFILSYYWNQLLHNVFFYRHFLFINYIVTLFEVAGNAVKQWVTETYKWEGNKPHSNGCNECSFAFGLCVISMLVAWFNVCNIYSFF